MQVSGGIFGELDFFLRHPRSFAAVSSTDDCTIQVLIRAGGGMTAQTRCSFARGGGRLIATDCDGLRWIAPDSLLIDPSRCLLGRRSIDCSIDDH